MADLVTSIYYLVIGTLIPAAPLPSHHRIPSGLRWLLHLVLLVLVLAGLKWLNNLLQVHNWTPDAGPARFYYLPIFGLLVYAAGWLVYIILRLVFSTGDDTTYVEIDRAWEEARTALERAGIKLTETPLFLVLGRPESPEEHFFQATKLQFTVRQTPPGAAPLHVYANHDVIYLTCAGSSLLGKQASNLALETLDEWQTGAAEADEIMSSMAGTLEATGAARAVLRNLVGRRGLRTSLERRMARAQLNKSIPNLLDQPHEVERLSGSLAHLCRRLREDRHPVCPMNGILLLLPLGGTDNDKIAQQTAEILKRDLDVVQEHTKLRCPIFAILADLESLPGFAEFVQKRGKQASRLGQRFPLDTPDLQGPELLEALGNALEHYCRSTLSELVYSSFEVHQDVGGPQDTANRNLFLMLHEMRQRKDHLSRLLREGLKGREAAPLLFGGCYLAATGLDERTQGFIRGIVGPKGRLHDAQAFVAWTDEALAEDQRNHFLAWMGWLLIALMFAAVVGWGVYRFWLRSALHS